LRIGLSPPGTEKKASVEHFIHQQNLALFRRLLRAQTDINEARRQILLRLLAEEEAKEMPSLPPRWP